MTPPTPLPPAGRAIAGLPDFPVGAIAGIVVLAIGSVGTWVTLEGGGVLGQLDAGSGGLDHDGQVTLPVALICAGLTVLGHRMRLRGAYVALAAVALLTVALVIVDAIDIAGQEATTTGFGVSTGPEIGIGWGVWVTLLGALVTAADGARLALPRRR